jgi:hypothetical protein
MNLEYHLDHFSDKIQLKINIDNHPITMLNFIILVQFDYFLSFFITILTDINISFPIKDLEFLDFSKKDWKNVFQLNLYYYPQPKIENISLSSFKIIQRLKYLNIYQLENQFVFQTNEIEQAQQFNELLGILHKKHFYKLLKSLFDKLYLKLLSSNKTFKIVVTYQPFLFLLKEI